MKPNRKKFLISYKLGFGILTIAAVVSQLAHGLVNSDFNTVNFFSFFTVEANLFAVVVFFMSAHAVFKKRQDPELDSLRGAATLYMLVTGVIYSWLLAGVDVQTAIPWVNVVLHYVFPMVVFLDWLYDRPDRKFTQRQSLLWLIFPVIYVVYTLIRGHFADWYPYPFINVTQHGYSTVLLNCLVIALGMIGLALIVGRLPASIPKKRLLKKS